MLMPSFSVPKARTASLQAGAPMDSGDQTYRRIRDLGTLGGSLVTKTLKVWVAHGGCFNRVDFCWKYSCIVI